MSFDEKSKLIVFPLHYEPEAVVSYFSPYSNQLDLVNQIFERLPPDCLLVLKEHPSQPGATRLNKWKDLVKCERVRVVKGMEKLSDLLAYESVVVSIGSKAALEASLLGRRAYVFGKPHYRDIPGVEYVSDISKLNIDWGRRDVTQTDIWAVSYTHLTLPTIYSV